MKLQRFLRVAFCTLLIGSVFPFPSCDGEKITQTILATYNIHNGVDVDYDFKLLAEDIARSGASVVALQEVDQNTSRNKNQDTTSALKRALGWNYACFAAGLKNYKGGEYGVALLSKYPIISYSETELPDVEAGLERRVLLEAVVQIEKTRLTCYVAHFNSKSADLQLSKAAEISAGKEPYVVMGDFNCEKFELFQKHFPSATFANLENEKIPTTVNSAAIDNMIFSRGISAESVTAIKTNRSDHFLLTAKVNLS